MSRWLDREEKPEEGAGMLEGLSRSGADMRPRLPGELESRKGFGANHRERILLKTREVQIRPSERAAMDALGRFRVIDAEDLVRGVYGTDGELAQADFRSLRRQGLIVAVGFRNANGDVRRILTLTRDGHDLVRSRGSHSQQLYWGFVKPAECEHDARLYRAYLYEERQLVAGGNSVKRVVLDYELKRQYFSRLNKPLGHEPYRKRQWESARELHLAIFDGHVVFPDFRVEYEDERGAPGRVDVELATGNYRGQHVTAKASAGFHVYADAAAGGRLRVDSGRLGGGRFYPEERSSLVLL